MPIESSKTKTATWRRWVKDQLDGVAVSDLDDGTDGELITWDAAGAATTVGVGTADQILTSNGAGAAPTFQDAAAGGGTWTQLDEVSAVPSYTFSSLPAGITKIEVMLDVVSPSTTTSLRVELGDSGGLETSGYSAHGVRMGTTQMAGVRVTNSFIIYTNNTLNQMSGIVSLVLHDPSDNDWVCVIGGADYARSSAFAGGGRKSLSGELTQIKVKSSAGTIDAGTVSIRYYIP